MKELKKRWKWIGLLLIVALVIATCFNSEEKDSFVHKTIKATIVEYIEKDGQTVIVLDDGLLSPTYVSLQSDTMYDDDKIGDIIESRETGAKIIVESEYWESEVYGDNDPPWIFPVMIIYTVEGGIG